MSADGGESPNAYVPLISVQVRCNWPPKATRDQVRVALMDCFDKAMDEMQADERMQS